MEDPVVVNWGRIERSIAKLGLRGVALAAGAVEGAIAAFEAATQLTLPDEVHSFFRAHDGQSSTKAGLASGFFFVSLSEAQKILADWAATRAKLGDGIKELDRVCSSTPPKAIQRKYSLPGWIPLARDSEGNAIGVDLQPGPAGAVGQVINFGRDEDDKFVLFPSVSALLEWLAAELEAGRIHFDDEDKAIRHVGGRLVGAIVEMHTADRHDLQDSSAR